jgi:hypothetical protein
MNNKFGDFWIRARPNPSNFDKFRQNAPNLLTLLVTPHCLQNERLLWTEENQSRVLQSGSALESWLQNPTTSNKLEDMNTSVFKKTEIIPQNLVNFARNQKDGRASLWPCRTWAYLTWMDERRKWGQELNSNRTQQQTRIRTQFEFQSGSQEQQNNTKSNSHRGI